MKRLSVRQAYDVFVVLFVLITIFLDAAEAKSLKKGEVYRSVDGETNVVNEFVKAGKNADFKKIADLSCKDFGPYLTLQDAQKLDLGHLGFIEEILREEKSDAYPENVKVVVVRTSVLGKMVFGSFFVFKTDKGWKVHVSEKIVKDYPIDDNVVSVSFSKFNYSNTVLKRCMFNALSNSNNEYNGTLISQTLIFDPSRIPFRIRFLSFNEKTGAVTAEMYNVTHTETVKFEGLLKSIDNLILKTTDGTQWNLGLSEDAKLRGTIYTEDGLGNKKLEIDIDCEDSRETIIPAMVLIPSGEFMAGEPNSLKGMVVKEFYIDKYEVTQREYEQVMVKNPSKFKGSNRPVDNVTWNEADEYCKKVGKRLPTEWEWEKAAKAGTTTTFYWGDSESMADSYAWHNKNSGGKTHPVGQKKPNAYGLFDMAGNVWEWTSTDYDSSNKVLRGGSWNNLPFNLWSSYRGRYEPAERNFNFGFRCAGASGQ